MFTYSRPARRRRDATAGEGTNRSVKDADIAAGCKSSITPGDLKQSESKAAALPSTRSRAAAGFKSTGLLGEVGLGQITDDLFVHSSAALSRVQLKCAAFLREVDDDPGGHRLVLRAHVDLPAVPGLLEPEKASLHPWMPWRRST